VTRTTRWTEVDRYLDALFVGDDPVLTAALAASAAAGLPDIQVSPAQGKLLHLLARAVGAARILEIGALGGYSTIWLARSLAPGGRVVTLEVEPAHARVARENVERAGLSTAVDVRLGAALDTLPQLQGAGVFDFVFIDADKPNIPAYFDWAIRLSRPGALIVVDNVVRDGAVVDAASRDAAVQGVRRFNEAAAADRRVSVTTVQTVGAKGYDGFALALVTG
jgi:predicted O-methyltransferase YrrM